MYLGTADSMPVPSTEVDGLIFASPDEIDLISRQSVTLEQYLATGGRASLRCEFDEMKVLEPFARFRDLSRILSMYS
jgi:hypothetical protein